MQTAKLTITAAANTLPPVLRHPCTIQLITTGVPYTISTISPTLQVIALGDGVIRSAKWYALANLAFSIQEEGRIVITSTAGATAPIVIDATGWAGFGDGPTSAFFVNNSRVLFNNIQFQGFTNPLSMASTRISSSSIASSRTTPRQVDSSRAAVLS